jgi:hypothetical protein
MPAKPQLLDQTQTALRPRTRLTIGVAPAEDVDVDVDGAEGLIRVLLLGMPLIFDVVCWASGGAICLIAVFAAAEGRVSLDEWSDENSTVFAAVVVLLSLGVSFLRFGIGVPTGIGLLVARAVSSMLVLDVAMLILRTFLLGVAGRTCVVTDADLLSSRRDELLFFFPGEGDSVTGDLFSVAYSTN